MTLIQLKSFCRFKTWCTSTHSSCLYIYSHTYIVKSPFNRKVLTLVLNSDSLKDSLFWKKRKVNMREIKRSNKSSFFPVWKQLNRPQKNWAVYFFSRKSKKTKVLKECFGLLRHDSFSYMNFKLTVTVRRRVLFWKWIVLSWVTSCFD